MSNKSAFILPFILWLIVCWLLINNRFQYGTNYPFPNTFSIGLLAAVPVLVLFMVYYYIDESSRLQTKSTSHSVLQFLLVPLFLFFSIKKLSGTNLPLTHDWVVLLLLCIAGADFSGHLRRSTSQIAGFIRPHHEIDRDLHSRRKELQQWGLITWATLVLVVLISSGIFKRS